MALIDDLGPLVRRSFMADIHPTLVEQVTHGARIHEVSSGQLFIGEARPNRCGLIVDGLARAYTVRADGSEATLRRVSVGACVGIHALFGRASLVNVQAISPVNFLELDPERVVNIAAEHSQLAMALAEELDRRLADTERQLEAVAGTVIQRLAAALLDMVVEEQPLVISISHERLAEIIGASRERVGQELRRLATVGVIEVDRATVTLIEPVRLQGIAIGWTRAG